MILNIIESDTEKRILLILFMQVNQLLIVFRLQNISNIPLNMLSFVQNLHINQGWKVQTKVLIFCRFLEIIGRPIKALSSNLANFLRTSCLKLWKWSYINPQTRNDNLAVLSRTPKESCWTNEGCWQSNISQVQCPIENFVLEEHESKGFISSWKKDTIQLWHLWL